MLRTLASYIFGGASDGPAQEPTSECKTRELNDWLVVNLPESDVDTIELDDETRDDSEGDVQWTRSTQQLDELEDMDEGDEREDMDEREDLDDVLESLPQLMASSCHQALSDEEEDLATSSDCEDYLALDADDYRYDNSQLERCEVVDKYSTADLVDNWFPLLFDDGQFSALGEALEDFREVCETLGAMRDLEALARRTRRLEVVQLAPQVQLSASLKAAVARERSKLAKPKRPSCLTCLPVYSSAYVNHRHPAAATPKTDLLQKIKELVPEQRPKVYVLKKQISRGNLNRQNKNYIFESSAKTNRRKNLQRNHSGANNNRKC